MCVQGKEPVYSAVRRITRSVAANSPKLALPSLYGNELKMSTPNRKIGAESLVCLEFHPNQVLNLMLTRFPPPCWVCVTVVNEKAKSERR